MPADKSTIHRLCLAVDVESYSGLSRQEQLDVQNRLLWTIVQACRAAGLNPESCNRQGSDSGQVLIFPPVIDNSTVIPNAVLGLLTSVYRVNDPAGCGGRVRLRVSISQGIVQVGATGFVGPAVLAACCLLDSNDLRAALATTSVGDTAFIVTSDLYHDMFAQGYGALAADGFHPVHVSKPSKGFSAQAWIQVARSLPLLASVPAYPDDTGLQRKQRAAVGGAGSVRDLDAVAAVAWAAFSRSRLLCSDSGLPAGHTATHDARLKGGQADFHAGEDHSLWDGSDYEPN